MDILVSHTEKEEKLDILRELMLTFTERENDIYQHLYVEQMSERAYERVLNVDKRTLAWRKQKMLQRLKRDFLKKI